MAPRHWTILIIPPDNGPTRSLVVTPRQRKALTGAAGAVAVVLATAVLALVTPYGTPGGRMAAVENARLRARLAEIDTRLASVNDSLDALGSHDQQLREIAGLPLRPAEASLGGPLMESMMHRVAGLSASFRAVSDTLARSFEKLARTPSIMPTAGWLSSHFTVNRFHPVLHASRAHEGIDVGAAMGSPIVAPASGTVRSVAHEPGYGNTFEIDHGDGIVTRFAHCSRVVVRVGQTVTRGQLIATVGNTGLSTGPHLHYEVHVNGVAVDPLRFVVHARTTGTIADGESDGRSP